jgi:hypothetical protein
MTKKAKPEHKCCGNCCWYEEKPSPCLGCGRCIWLMMHPGMAQELPFWLTSYPAPHVDAQWGADCHQYQPDDTA